MTIRPRSPVREPLPSEVNVSLVERRELTALCYDLVGSTGIMTRYDLDDVETLVTSFQERIGAIIRLHLGSTRDPWGDDGGMAFFGYPVSMEDGATAAIRASLDIVKACGDLSIAGVAPQVRVGIATSEVVVSDHAGLGPTIVGPAPALATRLQALAPPDTVLASDRTRALAGRSFSFKKLGPHRLKGFEAEQPVWEVGRPLIRPTRFLTDRTLGSRMVGRQAELECALSAWRRAEKGVGQTLLVQGDAGIGKSRLVMEVLRATRRQSVRRLVIQCSPHEVDMPMGPLAALLRSDATRVQAKDDLTIGSIARSLRRFGIESDEAAAAIAFAIGTRDTVQAADAAANPARLHRRLLDAITTCIDSWAAVGPILVVIEDIHWIDPTSAALLRDIGASLRGKPLLLILTSRGRDRWTSAPPHTEYVRLRPLRSPETASLAAALWYSDAGSTLPPEAMKILAKRTNGVPLFVQEIVSWLRQIAVPSSDLLECLSSSRSLRFETILSTHMGALGHAKIVAQSAAVIGRDFDERVLAKLVHIDLRDKLVPLLGDLSRAQMIARRGLSAERKWTFRHALIQETLYKLLGKFARRTLHKQILDILTDGSDFGPSSTAVQLGLHAEGAALHGRAATEYVRAARESFAKSAIGEAKNLLGRAQDCVEHIADNDERAQTELLVLATLGPLITSTEGTKSPAACQLYEQAMAKALDRPEDEQAALFPIYWGWWFTGADFSIQRTRAEFVSGVLRKVRNPEVQLQVSHCTWAMDFNLGHHRSCLHSIQKGLKHYSTASSRHSVALYGGHDARVCALGETGLSLWLQGFPTKAVAAVVECMSWAREIAHVGSIAHAYDIAAMLHFYREDFDALQATTTQMRKLSRKHELTSLSAKRLIFDGWRVAKVGEPLQGRRAMEKGFGIQVDIGTREDFPVYAGMRADILDLCFESRPALDLVNIALTDAERTSHLYWVPELHRRRAMLLAKMGGNQKEISAALESAMRVALSQDAHMLYLRACLTALQLGKWGAVARDLTEALSAAATVVEKGTEMNVLLDRIGHLRENNVESQDR